MMFAQLWGDESAVISIEYLLLGVVVGVGLAVGFSNVSAALNVEYTELGNAILALDQSYSYPAARGCGGSHGGVTATDTPATLNLSFTTATTTITITAVVINVTETP